MRKNIRHLLATFGLVGLLSCPENNSSSPVHMAQQQDNTESQTRELVDILKKRAIKGNYSTQPPALIDNISYKTYLDLVDTESYSYFIYYEEIHSTGVKQLALSKKDKRDYTNDVYHFGRPKTPIDYPDFPPSYLPTVDVFIFDEGIKGEMLPISTKNDKPRTMARSENM